VRASVTALTRPSPCDSNAQPDASAGHAAKARTSIRLQVVAHAALGRQRHGFVEIGFMKLDV
jgi:hypothetical protein